MKPNSRLTLFGFVVVALVFATTIVRAQDPLLSWNDTATKKAIVTFIEKVTKEGSPGANAPWSKSSRPLTPG